MDIPEEFRKPPEYYSSRGVESDSEFTVNKRGMKLCVSRWLPTNKETKALIFLFHGYSVDCGIWWDDTGTRLAEEGFSVFGIDYEGHGRSEGLRGFIPNIENLLDDCVAFVQNIYEKEEYSSLPRFLYGESFGGAVCLLLHRKLPSAFSGLVLIAPMCKISEETIPPAFLIGILKKMALVFPTWKILPVKDVIDSANKDPVKRERVRKNPFTYQSKPRLGTGLTFLNVTMDLQNRLDEVTCPFIVLHGEDDTVTDPKISQSLYENAKSFDKTIKLYAGMWHSLTEGEPDDNAEIVFKDIFEWLNERSQKQKASIESVEEASN